MSKRMELLPTFIETVPPDDDMEDGVLYVSEKYGTAIHMCACGCRGKTVMPINFQKEDGTMTTYGWDYTRTDNGLVSFSPSVGNFNFPCKSHYFIRNNKVEWC